MTNEQLIGALRYCNGQASFCKLCPLYGDYLRKGICTLPRDAAGRIRQLANENAKQKRTIRELQLKLAGQAAQEVEES